MLEAKLVIVAGADATLDYALRLPTTIGRSRENDIELPHPLVSRRHCELIELDGRLHVRDLGSLNGTFVGNKTVDGIKEIGPGQLLTIGTVTFRAVYQNLNSAEVLDECDDADAAESTSHAESFDTDAATTMVSHPRSISADTVPTGQTEPVTAAKKILPKR